VNAPATGPEAPPAQLPPGYPAELEGEAVLDDGTPIGFRPIRPDDAPALAEFHAGLSATSVYLRFFGAHPRLSEREVARFTHVDYHDRLALVALVAGRLTGVARYDRLEGDEAEVAFVVADDFQHHGIGTMLLERLADAARRRGVATFFAQTLAENRTMLDVFLHSGYAVTTTNDGQLVELRFPIDHRVTRPPAHSGSEPC
jgi:GNAT superfamily N-acetyltransferase